MQPSLERLILRVPTEADPCPELPHGIELELPALDGLDLEAPAEPADIEEIEPIFAVIEYKAADGARTRRRVTLLRVDRSSSPPCLIARCHERAAIRSFRADRITAMISADGEVLAPATLLGPLGIVAEPDDFRAKRARRLRERLRPGLTLLVALAQADGRFAAEEIDAILIWAENEAAHLGLHADPQDFDELAVLLKLMRPTREALGGCLRAALRGSRVERLSEAMRCVVHADGRLTEGEMALFEAIGLWSDIRDRKIAEMIDEANRPD